MSEPTDIRDVPHTEPAYAIETRALTRRFGKKTVVDHLTLRVPRGSIFAFLGRNGAGKTTTIRLLLDLLDRTSGAASLLGLDCVTGAREIRRRTGYVAQDEGLYDWMTVERMIWFCRGFYPTWDDALAADLRRQLDLPGSQRIRALSRGKQAQLALLLAMAFHPELLILDEPTAGLDVVVRREFLEGVIELAQEEGRTIFFSSHLVHEVERVADWVGIMEEGRLLSCAPLEEVKAGVRRIVCTFPASPPPPALPGLLHTEVEGKTLLCTVRDFGEATLAAARALHPATLAVEDLSLEDIFVALVGKGAV
ncbi:MAG TPA: ABC transporter ATP-binding protein [Armatimonadota bacterium]|nr:ABC transporter ATP-binding protein [Armatimonadota bacterium]HOS42258.1 ABC transporter ATP-binding protein [Armatimonadota bacterium]